MSLGMALSGAFVVLTLLAIGPLEVLDVELNRDWQGSLPILHDPIRLVVRLGQRAVCLPVLLLIALYAAHRTRSWYPLLLSATSVLVLNVVVGLTKIATARDKPKFGDPDFFESGIIYPSGHTANAVLVYGLAAFLVHRSARDRPRLTRLSAGLAVAISLAMLVCSLYLQTHWFTDLIAGWLMGGAVLASTVQPEGAVRWTSDHLFQVMGRLR